jgi:hypothetical protein
VVQKQAVGQAVWVGGIAVVEGSQGIQAGE